MGKPIGKFRCMACESEWDGSQLYEDPRTGRWTCGNIFCGANVYKIKTDSSSDRPDIEKRINSIG